MTEIALRQPASIAVTERDVVDGWVEVVTKIAKLADMIADTDFVPKALRNKPAAIAACMLTGREMGVGPMLSMKVIHMVQGTPSLAAEYKRARALAAGHEIVYEETTTTRCVVRGRRRGEDTWVTITWHIDDAKRAKLTGKDVWQQHPRRMLEARATGELCDLKFPDCSWGLATTEELEDSTDAVGVTAENGAPTRTAQRRSHAVAAIETAKPDERTPAAPADAVPLPGEDDPVPEPADDGDRHKALVGIVQQHFTRLGLRDRDARLLACEKLATTGPLESSKDLTAEQLSVVADVLARCRNLEQLNVLLTAGDKPGGGGGREPEGEAPGD